MNYSKLWKLWLGSIGFMFLGMALTIWVSGWFIALILIAFIFGFYISINIEKNKPPKNPLSLLNILGYTVLYEDNEVLTLQKDVYVLTLFKEQGTFMLSETVGGEEVLTRCPMELLTALRYFWYYYPKNL